MPGLVEVILAAKREGQSISGVLQVQANAQHANRHTHKKQYPQLYSKGCKLKG